MAEIEALTCEFLEDLEGLSPEEIEQVRAEWLADLRSRGIFERVEKFANAVIDCALQKARETA